MHPCYEELCLLDKLEIEGDKSVKCYVEGSVSTECKPNGERTITKKENKGGSGRNYKLSKHSLKECIQWRKIMVSDWKAYQKKLYIDISFSDFSVQQIYEIFKEIS